MLKSLIIEGLFGIYDYNLQFSKSVDDKIRFITAPNGFGKTTILKFINGLYNRNFEIFFSVKLFHSLFSLPMCNFSSYCLKCSFGCPCQARTDDTRINSPLLYLLS